ncbi:MAG TPA: hypothetical protein PLB89_13145 [Flavobacteriales bacterium]|nr:hypothetical protein [Flavobacteriales bacterium]
MGTPSLPLYLAMMFAVGVGSATAQNSPTIAAGNQTICMGGDPSIITFSTPPSNEYTRQWYYRNGIVPQPTGDQARGGH